MPRHRFKLTGPWVQKVKLVNRTKQGRVSMVWFGSDPNYLKKTKKKQIESVHIRGFMNTLTSPYQGLQRKHPYIKDKKYIQVISLIDILT